MNYLPLEEDWLKEYLKKLDLYKSLGLDGQRQYVLMKGDLLSLKETSLLPSGIVMGWIWITRS